MAIQLIATTICDICKAPSGAGANTKSEARTMARGVGYRRSRYNGEMVDVCGSCKAKLKPKKAKPSVDTSAASV